ncbi:MAG: NAD(P)H-dependent oxidoreductase subunit E, partial [Bacteroidales bacterium]|nr:NAD(P)H-dependent oxidoreductase subunit E [Bacteroidales bacterium]
MNKDIFDIVDKIIEKSGKDSNSVIPVLQAIQNEFNYLPEEALQRVCEVTEITLSQIYGVSTFYSQFRHKPVGKHLIKVCVGTACHVKGSMQVYDAFIRELDLKEGEDTDDKGIFTLDKVACLGCCTIAPVVQIDNVTYGHVNTEKVPEIINDFLHRETNPKHTKSKEIINQSISQGEIRIGLGSCCIASGSEQVKEELEKTLSTWNINVDVKQVGCVGICNQVPLMEIHKPGEISAFYAKTRPEEVTKILNRHFRSTNPFNRIKNGINSLFENIVMENTPDTITRYPADNRDTPISEFLGGQINIATEFRGYIKPSDLEEYKSLDGFSALRKCLLDISPETTINIITEAGLRGRGGAGFPTGKKWEFVRKAESDIKYVICNGDEGDPGAFMDRMLLESYPFRIIEGVIISAYAVGASEGFFYIRAEYPLAVKRIREAVQVCENEGILGQNILGSKFSFRLKIFEGAGAFVCGEETALIASVEGKRGMPSIRPPYPAIKGLWDKPTLINNTETFSMIPWIIRNGAEEFSKTGSGESKGSKVFALAGKINRGGLIEVPMGISIRTIVEKIGNGIPDGKEFKAVQIGGPS